MKSRIYKQKFDYSISLFIIVHPSSETIQNLNCDCTCIHVKMNSLGSWWCASKAMCFVYKSAGWYAHRKLVNICYHWPFWSTSKFLCLASVFVLWYSEWLKCTENKRKGAISRHLHVAHMYLLKSNARPITAVSCI